MMEPNIIELSNISKCFPGVKALDRVSLSVKKGHVHGLIGENGAGKSTLMKILSGVYQRDEGEIIFDGKTVPTMTPQISQSLGISIIYQEFNLVPVLSIAENIFLGRLGGGTGKKLVRWRSINAEASALLHRIGYDMDVTNKVSELSVAQMQMVEIAKALSCDARLIIMDEPSAPLTSNELETFFAVVKNLRDQGVSIIFISHKLDEIMQLCDEVTVMRDGSVIDTCRVS
ncbi:ATP-binding cassette domain-containing protein, partial [Massilicoli timonensis]|uniref:ATP-binding cassette domain-containing protein n=1 Tax=Massilicoli timonensis TaxID=2015901 RepID=UPI003AAB3923